MCRKILKQKSKTNSKKFVKYISKKVKKITITPFPKSKYDAWRHLRRRGRTFRRVNAPCDRVDTPYERVHAPTDNWAHIRTSVRTYERPNAR